MESEFDFDTAVAAATAAAHGAADPVADAPSPGADQWGDSAGDAAETAIADSPGGDPPVGDTGARDLAGATTEGAAEVPAPGLLDQFMAAHHTDDIVAVFRMAHALPEPRPGGPRTDALLCGLIGGLVEHRRMTQEPITAECLLATLGLDDVIDLAGRVAMTRHGGVLGRYLAGLPGVPVGRTTRLAHAMHDAAALEVRRAVGKAHGWLESQGGAGLF